MREAEREKEQREFVLEKRGARKKSWRMWKRSGGEGEGERERERERERKRERDRERQTDRQTRHTDRGANDKRNLLASHYWVCFIFLTRRHYYHVYLKK